MRPAPERVGRKQLLQLLRERRLRDPAASDTKQLDFTVERRIFPIVQRADDVVSGGETLVAVELAAGERDQVRRVQTRVLRVDRHEHLHDVIVGKPIENDRRDGERLVAEVLDVGMERQQAVLPVDGAQDPFAFRHFQRADRGDPASTGSNLSASSHEMMTAPGIDGRSRA